MFDSSKSSQKSSTTFISRVPALSKIFAQPNVNKNNHHHYPHNNNHYYYADDKDIILCNSKKNLKQKKRKTTESLPYAKRIKLPQNPFHRFCDEIELHGRYCLNCMATFGYIFLLIFNIKSSIKLYDSHIKNIIKQIRNNEISLNVYGGSSNNNLFIKRDKLEQDELDILVDDIKNHFKYNINKNWSLLYPLNAQHDTVSLLRNINKNCINKYKHIKDTISQMFDDDNNNNNRRTQISMTLTNIIINEYLNGLLLFHTVEKDFDEWNVQEFAELFGFLKISKNEINWNEIHLYIRSIWEYNYSGDILYLKLSNSNKKFQSVINLMNLLNGIVTRKNDYVRDHNENLYR